MRRLTAAVHWCAAALSNSSCEPLASWQLSTDGQGVFKTYNASCAAWMARIAPSSCALHAFCCGRNRNPRLLLCLSPSFLPAVAAAAAAAAAMQVWWPAPA
jgi:hypothetical protein